MKKAARIVIPLVLLTVVLVAALPLMGRAPSATTAVCERSDIALTVDATGTLEAAVAYEIGPPSVQGFWEYNLSWMIPEGSIVNKGDVIARFDATQIEDRLREHRAALETNQQEQQKEKRLLDVSLKQLQLDLTKAEGELKTVDLDLSLPEGMVPFIELERTRLERDLASRRVDFLGEKIDFEADLVDSKLDLLGVKQDFQQSKIDYNELAKSKFSVTAPVSGMVVYMPGRGGDRWEVGESVWMLAKIMKVADVSTLRVEASVLEVDAARVSAGQPARISVDAVPGMSLDSEVLEIGRIVRERSLQDQSKVFDVYLPLGEFDTDVLRPGMGVKVEIETSSFSDRLTIPVAGVRASSEGTWVLVDRGGNHEKRTVTLGARSGDRVIVESGLDEGERIVLVGPGARA